MNDPAEEKYLKMDMSPLHSRVLSLLDAIKDKHHICGMDNLYNSVAFYKACHKHSMKFLAPGTYRKWG